MVQFGRRFPAMQYPVYEGDYVRYDVLKATIEELSKCAVDDQAAGSNGFVEALTESLNEMDDLVVRQVDHLKKVVDKREADKLPVVARKVRILQHFVDTNIIATAKIIKKHDKAVSEKLSKLSAGSTLVHSLKCVTYLRTFRAQVLANLDSLRKAEWSTQVSVEPETLGVNNDSDKGDAACGVWLLAAAGNTVDDTYLAGWCSTVLLQDKELARQLYEESDSNWNVAFEDSGIPWSKLTTSERILTVVKNILRVLVVFASLYFFICSLSFLASGFRLVAGKDAGSLFRNSEVFNNPVAGMLLGVLVTVLVQSSSTSTSIVITMVAAELLTVKQAIYLIMGANIGTSVTSTIVAMGQVANRNEFRRAFAAATVHDMFNFMCVLVLLPLEAITGYLFRLSGALISDSLVSSEKPPDILNVLTNPFTKAIMSIDKDLIKNIAAADPSKLEAFKDSHILKKFFGAGPDDLSDGAAGFLVLLFALTILCTTLFLIVYMLRGLLKGQVAIWLYKSVNGDIPDIKIGRTTIRLGWITGYLALLAGFGITICVQSSSITTSALTPLVGVGVIRVERMYPVVLGANIGTCITGVLAALAADGSKLGLTLQVAYAHLFFNLTGIVLFYVIWPMRRFPIAAAKFLGNTTATYRWFAVVYLFACFFLAPAIWVGLSLAGTAPLVIVTVLVILVVLSIATINVLQTHKPQCLPETLRTWRFLPVWMRSLEPLDRVVCKPLAEKSCCGSKRTVAPA